MTRGACGALLVFALAACARDADTPSPSREKRAQSPTIVHEAYVWQRRWTPALRESIAEGADVLAGLRVLVAQFDRAGARVDVVSDADALATSHSPATAVIRIDGGSSLPSAAALADIFDAASKSWRDADIAIAGIEIDYDCATARLPAYVDRLVELRARLPIGTRLSITALPSWLESPELAHLLDGVDEPVLQVHSVLDPTRGLFDAALAERWIRAFAAQAPRGFRIALPTYGARVRVDANGRVDAVESEMPLASTVAGDAREIAIDPAAIVALLERLEAKRPPNWLGVVWFRLPTADDRRAWSSAALRAVIEGRVPAAVLRARATPTTNGSADVTIANDGDADAAVPNVRIVGVDCRASDAADGFRVDRSGDDVQFVATENTPVRARHARAVGWVRCDRIGEVRVDESSLRR